MENLSILVVLLFTAVIPQNEDKAVVTPPQLSMVAEDCLISTVRFFGSQGPCDDNGTPNDPRDDLFTHDVHASFFNRPLTGSLQIVPGGDAIGTYSILSNSIVGNSHTFQDVHFKADGTPTVVTLNFTDEPTCSNSNTGPTVAPCSTPPPPCTITVNFSGNPGPCDDNGTPNDLSDDFFTHNVSASFFNRPFTGSLQIVPGGDVIGSYSILTTSIVGNSHIFNNVKFKADGTPTVVTMNFTDDPSCSDTKTGPTVAPCSTPPPPCTITVNFFGNPGPCNNNGTPSDPSDDFLRTMSARPFLIAPLPAACKSCPAAMLLAPIPYSRRASLATRTFLTM
ncbi:MAG: hypothetical protein IPN33_03685 [Saprospiraceae bacterium]|nr:hypothetical protein [Saprospiraceae bacterium]